MLVVMDAATIKLDNTIEHSFCFVQRRMEKNTKKVSKFALQDRSKCDYTHDVSMPTCCPLSHSRIGNGIIINYALHAHHSTTTYMHTPLFPALFLDATPRCI